MKFLCSLTMLGAGLILADLSPAQESQPPRERLPVEILHITAPSSRVTGSPGTMRFSDTGCRSGYDTSVRSRIVNAAVQEWAYFGFSVLDYTESQGDDPRNGGSRRSRMSSQEAMRVADSIAGYWAATPGSAWILERQNDRWSSAGMTSRWRDPWSAAFISWVMCEAGLGETEIFARAVAHHTYIDQAILARDEPAATSAFIAYEPGEQPVLPGDMLCRGSRPAYQSIDDRRAHLGEGARTHCDIVVKVDEADDRFMVIGGNVRGTVGMKYLPAAPREGGHLSPVPFDGRRIFAHLMLRADPVPLNALDQSPTLLGTSGSE